MRVKREIGVQAGEPRLPWRAAAFSLFLPVKNVL